MIDTITDAARIQRCIAREEHELKRLNERLRPMTPTQPQTDPAVLPWHREAAKEIHQHCHKHSHGKDDLAECMYLTLDIARIIASHAPAPAAERDGELARYKDALLWIQRDAAYKPPEQRFAPDVTQRWLSVVERALSQPAPTAPTADEAGKPQGAIDPRLVNLLKEELGVSTDQIKPEANLRSDLGADETDIVEICMRIEEEFGIEFNVKDWEPYSDPAPTVAEVIAKMAKARHEPQGGELDLEKMASETAVAIYHSLWPQNEDIAYTPSKATTQVVLKALLAVQTAADEKHARLRRDLELSEIYRHNLIEDRDFLKADLAAAKQHAIARDIQNAEWLAERERMRAELALYKPVDSAKTGGTQ